MLAIWCWSALILGLGVGSIYEIHTLITGETTFVNKHHAAILACIGLWLVCMVTTFPLMSHKLRKGDSKVWRSMSLAILPLLLFFMLVGYFQSYPEATLTSLTLCGFLIIFTFFVTVQFNFLSIWSYRSQLFVRAQRQAQHQLLLVENGNSDSKENKEERNTAKNKREKDLRRYSVRATLRKALLGGLPSIFIYGIGFLYVFVFFEVYNATSLV